MYSKAFSSPEIILETRSFMINFILKLIKK
jgi:hypothetical protein